MSKETGLKKLDRLMQKETEEKVVEEVKEEEKEIEPGVEDELAEDAVGDEEEAKVVEKKSFDVMITLFCKFLMLNPLVAPLRLRMSKDNNGYVVYQGTIHHPWVFLRLGKCNFIRSALLDYIKRLPEEDFLYRYFEGYTKKN